MTQVRSGLSEALEATRLRPGDVVVLAKDITLKASSSQDQAPLVGVVDLRIYGLALALLDAPVGRAWRRFVACLTPDMLSLGGGGLPELTAAVSAALKDRPAAGGLAGGSGQQWLDCLRHFGLHMLREKEGRGDDGLVLGQLQLERAPRARACVHTGTLSRAHGTRASSHVRTACARVACAAGAPAAAARPRAGRGRVGRRVPRARRPLGAALRRQDVLEEEARHRRRLAGAALPRARARRAAADGEHRARRRERGEPLRDPHGPPAPARSRLLSPPPASSRLLSPSLAFSHILSPPPTSSRPLRR